MKFIGGMQVIGVQQRPVLLSFPTIVENDSHVAI